MAAEDIVVRPRTAISCHGKLSSAGGHGGTFQITPVDYPFIKKDESVVEADNTGRIPIMMANATNATIRIPKGREVGKTITANFRKQPINRKNSSDGNINSIVKEEEIVVPEEYNKKVVILINKNKKRRIYAITPNQIKSWIKLSQFR